MKELLETIDLRLQGIVIHAQQLTSANVAHHRSYIQGTAQQCIADLKTIKKLSQCKKKK